MITDEVDSMVLLAKENLKHDRQKVAISIGGVVISVFLILTMVGLYQGFDTMMDDMAVGTGADLWVTSEGASGSLHSPSLLPLTLQDNITVIEGVAESVPFIRTPISIEMNEEKVLIYLNSHDLDTGMGGPWSVIEGNSTVNNGEIIIDKVLASKYDLEIGGNFTIEGREFQIVGISSETYLMIAHLVFVTFEDAKGFLLDGITNYYLVTVEPSYDVDTVKASISDELPDVSISTTTQTSQAYKDELLGGFMPIFLLLSLIGFLVGIQVIGVLVYSLTMDKAREYGILKAVGANNNYLYKVVVGQALAIALIGFVTGSLIVPPLLSLLETIVPEFIVEITIEMIITVSALGLLTGLIASVTPVRKLAKLDPAQVFKEV